MIIIILLLGHACNIMPFIALTKYNIMTNVNLIATQHKSKINV